MDTTDTPARPFSRADFLRAGARVRLLNAGSYANARVYVYDRPDGAWVVKDFAGCAWPVRVTVGRIMVRREISALTRLDGVPGVAPSAFLIDAHALGYRYLAGAPLPDAPRERLNGRFFRKLERVVWRMHRRGIAHLDLRYRRNVLALDDGSPAVIDFQSRVVLDRLPRRLCRLLRRVDYSGVYKHWCIHSPETLGTARLGILRGSNRLRGWWMVKGYRLVGLKRHDWRLYEEQANRRDAPA